MTIKSNLTKALGLGVVLVAVSAGTAFAAVATASANVRTGPSTGYRIVDRLYPGEVVAIVDRSGSWCAIDKPGPNGWVKCYFLTDSRFGRFDRFARPPSVTLQFGFGMQPHPHPHPFYPGGMFSIY